jgi:hypothetical protein
VDAALRLRKLVAYEADLNGNNVHCFFFASLDAWVQAGNPRKYKNQFKLRWEVKVWLQSRPGYTTII